MDSRELERLKELKKEKHKYIYPEWALDHGFLNNYFQKSSKACQRKDMVAYLMGLLQEHFSGCH